MTLPRPLSVRTRRNPRGSSPSVPPLYPPSSFTCTSFPWEYDERDSTRFMMGSKRKAGVRMGPFMARSRARYSRSRDRISAATISTRGHSWPASSRRDVTGPPRSGGKLCWFTLIPLPTTPCCTRVPPELFYLSIPANFFSPRRNPVAPGTAPPPPPPPPPPPHSDH